MDLNVVKRNAMLTPLDALWMLWMKKDCYKRCMKEINDKEKCERVCKEDDQNDQHRIIFHCLGLLQAA